MLLEKSTAEVMKISDVKGLDPITVITADYEPGKGRIWISCFDQVWMCYWGAMGAGTIRNFWLICDADYLVGNLLATRRAKKSDEAYLLRIVRAVQEAFEEELRPKGGAA